MRAICRCLATGLLLATLAIDCRADRAPPRHCELLGVPDLKPGDPDIEALTSRRAPLLRVCTSRRAAALTLTGTLPPELPTHLETIHQSDPVDGDIVLVYLDPSNGLASWRIHMELVAGRAVVRAFHAAVF